MNISFIEFLAKTGSVKFGEFTLKSGRISPFFISTGVLADGQTTYELGKHYAKLIYEKFGNNFDAVYGPAYKGIPLAVAVSIALYKEFGVIKPWIFDRKEKKTYGDSSAFVGAELDKGAKIILVDDVLTTGGTKLEAIEKIEKGLHGEVAGIVIAVDRLERGLKFTATQEFTEQTGVEVYSITTITDVFEHLKEKEIEGKTYVTEEVYNSYIVYRRKYS